MLGTWPGVVGESTASGTECGGAAENASGVDTNAAAALGTAEGDSGCTAGTGYAVARAGSSATGDRDARQPSEDTGTTHWTVVKNIMSGLLEIAGVGPIVAGVLLAETADPKRFAAADHFASYSGVAPVERGSGQNSRVQVNPGGNRRLNWALHIVAMVRLKTDGGRSRALVDKVKSSGKTQRAALRVLKTYIARELFRAMRYAST
jgi:transposase IS116/IS110/IS902 family protein